VLSELLVSDLGVIASVSLLVEGGMTALTGETGAGKTMLVTAIQLLAGGRAEPGVVRPGAAEARVDGRFVRPDGGEVVLSRVVPADGRSRAYVDGAPVPAARLAELAAELLDLHGQHAHQSLLAPAVQRSALDTWGGVDVTPLAEARAALSAIEDELAGLGGDTRARAREVDLLRFQVDELDAAAVTGPDEDDELHRLEVLLGDATAVQEAAVVAQESLTGDGGAADAVGASLAALASRPAYAEVVPRLRATLAELSDIAGEIRGVSEQVDDDPERLAEVGARRALLRDLRRKYGESLSEVLAYHDEVRARLAELDGWEGRAAELEAARATAQATVAGAEQAVAEARRRAAPGLAAAVQARLQALAMPRASVEVAVGGAGAGDDIQFLLAANPGEPAQPLTKVASGGELARAMLALRLALLEGDTGAGVDGRTLVFDEVDAGIGGEAALAVGAALAQLAATAQVLVVTHLPQVAAAADQQVAVSKSEEDGRTVARAVVVEGPERVIELSRMLSGQPESVRAREHAEELLAGASAGRAK
jgi:DNA repair protein RecN (Recombination protein N)